jgi:hypothetical protein
VLFRGWIVPCALIDASTRLNRAWSIPFAEHDECTLSHPLRSRDLRLHASSPLSSITLNAPASGEISVWCLTNANFCCAHLACRCA